ncbi:hypothetical protein TWF481_004375 [Arthrobotrys musiformis]|uniref:Uncharacterized protein n=1 Tax=Arthrobotrys musiformis TaxID=47236 RepID=A0AAV9WJE4_9PEZI
MGLRICLWYSFTVFIDPFLRETKAILILNELSTCIGADPSLEVWVIEYRPYWFDIIEQLDDPISEILQIMNDYYIDAEYCPVSEEDDVLGTGQSLERYGQMLHRILPIFNESAPYILEHGSDSDVKLWDEVGDTLSAYLKLLEKLYVEMLSAALWLARIPGYNYSQGNYETLEHAVVCVIVNCTYVDEAEKRLPKSEVEARYNVEFDEDAQQKFVDAVKSIAIKFELQLNIINGLVSWESGLESSNLEFFEAIFSDFDGMGKSLKSVIGSIRSWLKCRSSKIWPLLEALEKFPSVGGLVEELSRDL